MNIKTTKGAAALVTVLALFGAACAAEVDEAAEGTEDAAATATTEAGTGTSADETETTIDNADNPFELAFDGLEPLGEGFVYEGWAIVDGDALSTGRFSIGDDGEQTFHVESLVDDVSEASSFVLTIEPSENDVPEPTDVHVLAGDIEDGKATLNVSHPASLGDDFSDAAGEFIIATPTTTTTDDELSGVWFLKKGEPPAAGLDLPTLPSGWVYEGWAVIDGQPVSTGRFTDPTGPDDSSEFSGTDADAPPFPGEDFIQNAPDGLEFPVNLTDATVVISIEPENDDSPNPFAFKPLAAEIPAAMGTPEPVTLEAGPGFPTGTATVVS